MAKYIITDPCYLVSDHKVWASYCRLIKCEVSNGDTFLSELLGTEVKAASTGYGDWSNDIACVKGRGHVISNRFCADAGLVCFCELTPEIYQHLETAGYGEGCCAIIEAENPVCTFNEDNPDWTVITITDDNGAVYMSSEELEYDDEDY